MWFHAKGASMENERTEKLSMNNLVRFSLSRMNDGVHIDDPSDSHHPKGGDE